MRIRVIRGKKEKLQNRADCRQEHAHPRNLRQS
jgi:hypothetical protein